MTHSLAGGTGSGLGSRLLEEYRDHFGKAYLMTISVWPSEFGDTPLQHYNTCLSLAHIQNNADVSINFQNDVLLKALNRINITSTGDQMSKQSSKSKDQGTFEEMKQSKKNKDGVVTMKNLNEYIASVVKNVLYPQMGERFDFTNVTDLACMPQFKFL